MLKPTLMIIGAVAAASVLIGAKAPDKAGNAKAAAARRMPVPSVLAGKVKLIPNTVSRKYIGMLNAELDATLVARVSGSIEKQLLRDGSLVRKGQVIVQIEDTVYKAKVQSAKAMVAQTQAELKNARSNFDRQTRLYKQKATSQTVFEDAQKVYYTTRAKLDYYKALLVEAQNDLNYTKVRAPFSGRIGRVMLSIGNYVTPGTKLVQLVSLSPVNVDFAISARDILSQFGSIKGLSDKAAVKMTLADGKAYAGSGRISFIDNVADSTTDTVEVRAKYDNKNGKLIPGGLVTIHLTQRDPKPITAVPAAALLNGKQGSFVYVIGKDNVAKVRPVITGAVIDEYQIVYSGLKAGETIVIAGSNKVFPGMPVKPVFETDMKGSGK